jgi:hypothetical protein
VWWAVSAGIVVREAVGVDGLASESDIERAADWAGARIRYYPGVPDLPAVQARRSIWLSDDLGARRRFVVAHELGHVRLGHGLNLYTSSLGIYGTREEHQADAFACALLLGAPCGPRFDEALMEAQESGVPGECLLRFLDAVGRGHPAGFYSFQTSQS